MMTVTSEETDKLSLNLRQKLEVFIDTAWFGTTHPAFPQQGERLTPLQAIARYEMCRRSGGHDWIALKAVTRDGRVLDIAMLRRAVKLSRSGN
jgi:hypothetical protein